MIIKQGDAVKAYKSISDLNAQKLSSGKMAKSIYNLYKKLKEAYDFQIQEEMKIFNAHPDFDPAINGFSVKNKTEEEKIILKKELAQIEKEFKDLYDLDFEIEVEPFDFNLDQLGDVKISGSDIGNLESFINFI